MLEAREVSYVVDSRAIVAEASLVVAPGVLLGLVGPNGSGKTTLVRLLAGEFHPTSGAVTLQGRPLETYPAAETALRRAWMPQVSTLVFPFTAWQVVLMGRYPHVQRIGYERHEDRDAAAAALRRVGMSGFERRLFPTLSGGERSRVTLARVLAQETAVLLLDEPTSHLDPRHQQDALRLASELTAGGGAVLAVLHDLNLAAAWCDRVAVMAEGRIRAVGDARSVMEEGLLEDVFDMPFRRVPDPRTGRPVLIPAPPDRTEKEISHARAR